MMDAEFQAALLGFVAGGQKLIDDSFAKDAPNVPVPTLMIDPNGRNYIRIVKVGEHERSVWCFIAVQDVRTKALTFRRGDVAKAASFKAPAAHARGNIFDESNGLGSCSWTGPAYL